MSFANIAAASDVAGIPSSLAVSGTPAGARESRTAGVNPWKRWVRRGRNPSETAWSVCESSLKMLVTCIGHTGYCCPGWNSSSGVPDLGRAGGCKGGVDDGARPSTYSRQQPFGASV